MTSNPPAGSVPGPLVLRPRLVRIVSYVLGAVVLIGCIAATSLMSGVDVLNRVLFPAFGLAVMWFCHREGSVRAVATPEGLEVRNLFATRQLDWAEIVGISFPTGDPWAHLDLADGDTLGVMALQRSDGPRGMAGARTLAGWIRDHGEAPSEGL